MTRRTDETQPDNILLIAALALGLGIYAALWSRYHAWVDAVDACALDLSGDPEVAWRHCAASTPRKD